MPSDPFGMEGVTAVVTGGAASVGRTIASSLAERGAAVVIGDVDGGAGTATATELTETTPGRATFVETDVTSSAECEDLVAAAVDHYGGLDVLVNNAGHRELVSITDATDEDWRRHLAVNLDGAFYCCRAAVPRLRASDRPRIVNLSSGVTRIGHPRGGAPYVAAKSGVNGLTRALALELGGDGITVNAVAPSIVRDSGMQDGVDEDLLDRRAAENPRGRLPRREDVAFVVLCLVSERGGMIHGQTIDVNGGRWMR